MARMILPSLVFALALGAANDPFAQLPPILWTAPDALESEWREVRRLPGEGAVRVREYWRRGLERAACRGLVDLRSFDATRLAGLAWQDDVAGREWARPALARVLTEAHAAWRARHPALALAVGDVAQAGCGQVDPGTLTRFVKGDAIRRLAGEVRSVAGEPVALAIDGDGKSRVLTERRVVARGDDGEPVLLVRVRRYRALQGGAGGLEGKLRALVAAGELVHESEGPGPDGATEWRQHWVDGRHFRQAILVVTAKRKGFRLEDARDARIAPWAPARPGEARGERRWTRSGEGSSEWQAWQLIEEGAHVTHMAGRDADLSYPVDNPRDRFSSKTETIDVAATWDWFQTVVATGDALGTPIERIVLGGRVLARLLREVPGARGSPLVKRGLLKVVANHENHQHLHLAVPSAEDDATSLGALMAAH